MGKSFDYTHNNPDFDKTPPYLLGTIYVIEDTNDSNGKKVRQLIDGQQRLTTICLSVLVWIEMYSAMMDDPKIKKEIDELDSRLDFTCKELRQKAEEILTERKTPKLIYPQEVNNLFWARLCKCSTSVQFNKQLDQADLNIETQKNIVGAFNSLRKCMAEAIDDFSEDNQTISWKKTKRSWDLSKLRQMVQDVNAFEQFMTRFAGLLATILYCVCLVQFRCTATQQVSLFDIINNRGERFDMPDMVRLMLFSRVKQSKHEELNRIWTTAKVNKNILPCVWNAFYASDEKDLARNKLELQIEDRLSSSGLSDSQRELWVMTFATRCSSSALKLSQVESFNDVLLTDTKFAKVAFITSNDYQKFTHPIYFALEEFIDDSVLSNKIYSYLLNLVVRITIVKEKDTRVISKTLPGLAINICQQVQLYAKQKADAEKESLDSDENVDKPEDLLKSIKKVVKDSAIYQLVGDEEFVNKFKEFVLPSSMTRFGYLVIASLENALSGASSACTLKYYGKAQEQNNNLEHIYPQNADKSSWPDCDSESAGNIGKIGNFLPLASSANSACGNRSIKDKVTAYAESGLKLWGSLEELIKQSVGNSPSGTWTLEKIDIRTDYLATQAKKVFKLD